MLMRQLRQQIDQVDQELLKLLAKRQKLILEISDLKKGEGLPVVDLKREHEMRERLKIQAEELELDPKFVDEFFQLILSESHHLQA